MGNTMNRPKFICLEIKTTIGASKGKWYAEFKAGTINAGSPYKYNQFGIKA